MNFTCHKTLPTAADEITLSGVTYVVEQVNTPSDHDAAGRPNVARLARQHGGVVDIVVRRKRGKKVHLLRTKKNSAGIWTTTYCMAI